MTIHNRGLGSMETKTRYEVRKIIDGARWKFNGMDFETSGYFSFDVGQIPNVFVAVDFSCNLAYVKAKVRPAHEYQIQDSVSMFTGETALGDVIEWTVGKLLSIVATMEKRLAKLPPFSEAEYKNILKGA